MLATREKWELRVLPGVDELRPKTHFAYESRPGVDKVLYKLRPRSINMLGLIVDKDIMVRFCIYNCKM